MADNQYSSPLERLDGIVEDEFNDNLSNTVFDPPFYGHPMLIPPSPSLTTMLRARSTTPEGDEIDVSEMDQQEWDIMVKVPTYEYYGFVLYLVSMVAFGLFICWAILPASAVNYLEIQSYLSRWWALAIPSWILVLIIYIHVALTAYNTEVLTRPLNSLEYLVDQYSQVGEEDRAACGRVVDLRLCDVNRQRYEATNAK
ncbi:pig-P subunit [Schizosaccharomyces octosporus yFS286]|uniref:Pig-P subunit n=1 Tax=Schizosaccharomyces octosporus (strain yFS286) TaxID=483514 RepID=S9Q3S3_SCHOY|nr:pig-P subunit [Schizosaccharomyces octosporus yFS286]EPX74727.1 pig-P subunit [Schizosaccharomyces octosporus yFS286]